MAYKRKTQDEYVVQGYYSREYGWEDVSIEDTYREGKACLKVYNENEPNPHRLKVRRVPIAPKQG